MGDSGSRIYVRSDVYKWTVLTAASASISFVHTYMHTYTLRQTLEIKKIKTKTKTNKQLHINNRFEFEREGGNETEDNGKERTPSPRIAITPYFSYKYILNYYYY